jgi:hypothetical protein
MQSSKLFSATSWPTVFLQERFQVSPSLALVPGVPQRPAPPTFGLLVGSRCRIDDHPD